MTFEQTASLVFRFYAYLSVF